MLNSQNKRAAPRLQVVVDNSEEFFPAPLDRPIAMTHFPDQHALVKEEKAVTLRGFAREIAKKKAPSKGELPFRKLARFGDVPTLRGSLRSNANVKAVSGVEGDYDGEVVSIDEAEERCREAGVAALFYETASATPDKPRWRVMAPFDKEHPPEERARFLARLNGVLGGILAPESFILSQSYYFGGVDKTPRTILVDGEYLDRLARLDAGAIGKPTRKHEAGDAVTEPIGYEIEDIRAAVMAVPNGGKYDDRGEWLRFLAAIHHETEGSEEGREIAHEWSQQHPTYDEGHTDAAWNSFRLDRPGGATFATVLQEAKRNGWHNPTEDDFEYEGPAPDREQPQAKSTLRFLHADELAALPEAIDFVEGILFENQLSTIIGRWGSGKTFFALDLALHVALGRKWRERGVEQGVAIYIALEGVDGIRRRFRAWCERHGVDPETVPIVFADGSFDVRKGTPTKRRLIAFAKEAEEKWGLPVRLIVIDTLARAMAGGNENTAEDMGAFRAGMDFIRRGTGANVCVIHHTGKDESKGARGSNLLVSDVDTEITIERVDDGRLARLTKQKEGPDGDQIGFALDKVDLGYTDRWGKPVTSCVVVPDDVPVRSRRLTPAAQAALDILMEMTGSTEGVSEIEWRKACVDTRKVSAAEDEASRARGVRRAVATLAQEGQIEVRAGLVFISPDCGGFTNEEEPNE